MNNHLDKFVETDPFSLDKSRKGAMLNEALTDLTRHHYDRCPQYRRILDALDFNTEKVHSTEDFPFLPVQLFKEYDLLSIDRDNVIKTMTSSGTTGQRVSKIYLDKDAARNQTKVLSKIVASYLGQKRLPLLIIDTDSVISDRTKFSARGAGILGFSNFGSDPTYALNDDMEINIEQVKQFLERHRSERILLFGFTYMIWQHFYRSLKKNQYDLDLSNGIMIHGGGWKKLADEAVDNDTFKQDFRLVCGLKNIFNYYGMVEQTGSIFMECEHGYLHAPIFSDILIRNARDFSVAKTGEKGITEVISMLPTSYPGHILLTEDIGEIAGEDDCPCGRKGKYFKIHGRIKNAEIRGCSDTYESKPKQH